MKKKFLPDFRFTNTKKVLYLAVLLGYSIYNILEGLDEIEHDNRTSEVIKVYGDNLQVLIPVLALSLTIIENDDDAQFEFIKTAVATFAVTHFLKHSVNASRPNGGNRSFPSGHTSSAFQGAAFLHQRYGLLKAFPGYIAASYVGFSRVFSKRHHSHDVVAGAIIAIFVVFKSRSKSNR